ncbi:MAG TPA: hypothetical protein VI997_06635 [Candidatus Thermoplasmatota archaeon]|nr:hypothetical protein [Candidatus Thermoplasmatota archaeon]
MPEAASFAADFAAARDYVALFRVVKRVVERELGRSRAGMMLGLAPLGLAPDGFLGGYFVVGSNAIVLNRDVLRYVQAHAPEHVHAYAFHVLLHEYLHTLGWFREDEVRPLALDVSRRALGDEHPATRIAAAMVPGAGGEPIAFFRNLVYPPFGWAPRLDAPIEIVKGFDPDASTGYIQ